MPLLLLGLLLFLASHSMAIVAPGLRGSLAGRLGANGYKGLAAIIAALGFWLIVRGFGEARPESLVLYTSPTWMRHIVLTLMLPVFPLLIGAYLKGYIKARLKHPMLVAVKLWAFAHLLVNGRLADVVLFGSLLAWAVFDRISIKRRPNQPPLPANPSIAHDAIAVVAGLALYVLFVMSWHLKLIGVSPLG